MTKSPAQVVAPPTILVVLPRGEAIRNFVYSGALELLRADARVEVAGVVPSGEVVDLIRSDADAFHPIDAVSEHRLVRLSRSLLHQAHGRRIWSEAAQERWRRRDLEAVALPDRVRRAGWRIGSRAMSSERGLAAVSKVERAASRRYPPAGGAEDLVATVAPDLVFNTSHIHAGPATPLVQAARWQHVPTATFLFSWDNLTSQGRLLDIYDHFLAWNEAIARDLLGMYPRLSPDCVRVTGTPQFDSHFDPSNVWSREHWSEVVGVDPDRPVVLYTTGMANHMPGEEEIVEGIADALKGLDHLGRPQLLVRVYAKDRTGRFDDLRSRRPDIAFSPVPWHSSWLTPLPADTALWTSTLAHAACGINVASTVSLELCMFDKPVVNVAFNPPSVPKGTIDYARYYRFDHYAPVVAAGSVALVEHRDDVASVLRNALERPEAQAAGRRRVLRDLFGDTLDGRSAQRVTSALLELAGRTVAS